MCAEQKRKFLFRCNDCAIILAVEFEDPEDLENIQEDKIFLECPCQGQCAVMRN